MSGLPGIYSQQGYAPQQPQLQQQQQYATQAAQQYAAQATQQYQAQAPQYAAAVAQQYAGQQYAGQAVQPSAQQYAGQATQPSAQQYSGQQQQQQQRAPQQYAGQTAQPTTQQYQQYTPQQYAGQTAPPVVPQYGQYGQQQMYVPQPPTQYGQSQGGAMAQYNKNAVVPANPTPAPGSQPWSSSSLACCDDMYVCCVGYFLPSCLYGENYRKIYGDGCCCACMLYYFCGCFACCFANHTRGALRSKYGLPEEPCGDCCVHCWCSPCAVCQEARELRKREKWQTWV